VDYKKIKIILIEDNFDDANLTIFAFRSESLDKNILHLKDGEEAIKFFFENKSFADQHFCEGINVILLDLHLPKVDGRDVLRQLKQNEKTKEIPVVILTSSNNDPIIEECNRLGADSFIVKPVTADGFIKVINGLGRFWAENNRL
jgi:two-component system, response regulator